MQKENKLTRNFIIGTFVTLYIMVSVISTIHVIDFFELSNPKWLAITLAIAFEVGSAASLASIIVLKKMNKGIVWFLFIILTLMQAMGNTYYAFVNLKGFEGWVELFGLIEEDLIQQKRIVSIISGVVLPLVALGFIKSLVDYIRPEDENVIETSIPTTDNTQITDAVTQPQPTETVIESQVDDLDGLDDLDEWDVTLYDGLNDEPFEEEEVRSETNKEELKKYIMDFIEKNEVGFEKEETLETIEESEENIIEPIEETLDSIEVDEENYPVYDNSKEAAKKAALDNIMVFVKNGN